MSPPSTPPSSHSRRKKLRRWIRCSAGRWKLLTTLSRMVRYLKVIQNAGVLTVCVVAGLPVDSLKGSRTAVFSASMLEDYSRMTAVGPDSLERTAVTGSTVSCIIPNRVSWYFDLRGPSIHVNTACSSSLSAVDMACKALKSGDASCAVVTGANLLLDPSIFQVLANQGFLSPDGVCYSFDERVNGYARGEGVIAVVLKPVQAAIENGNMI
ncbi:Polyketide synthase, beta-ketoacyl synthase domain [Fusarium oxysporum f. sp. vasinfectum]|nr:Polyketide synthase, beta-ketoacyl synthase domain [Fusarium oxysporum f. sp. vasinfectum]